MRWHFANRYKTSSPLKVTTPLCIFTEASSRLADLNLEILHQCTKIKKAIQECYIKRAYKYVGREGSVVGCMKTVELNNGGGVFKIDL